MTYQFEEQDRKELAELIKKGRYPEGTTLDEYHYLVNQAIDRQRGK